MCSSYCINPYCSIIDVGMLCSSFILQNSPTRPTNSSPPPPAPMATSLPKSSKTPATEIPSTSRPQVSLHAQIDSSCLYSDHYLHAPLRLPLFCADNTTALADPTIEFHSPYWNLVSDKAKSFICRLAALDPLPLPPPSRLYAIPGLTLPPPTRRPTLISSPP